MDPTTRTDLEKWRAKRDQGAFERLWKRYKPGLEALIARGIASIKNAAVRDRLARDRDDILQDAMGTILKKLPEFEYRGPRSLLLWMETIAANKVTDALDYWKARKRVPQREQPVQGYASETKSLWLDPPDRRPGPRTELEQGELRERVLAAVVALPDRAFRIILMREYWKHQWEDIAVEVGSPSADAVRKEHAKAVLLLRTRSSDLKGLIGGD